MARVTDDWYSLTQNNAWFKTFSRITTAISAVLFLIASVLAYVMLTGANTLDFMEPSPARKMQAYVYQLSQSLPTDVDDELRLEHAEVTDGALRFTFTLKNYTVDQIDVDYFRADTYQRSRMMACLNSQLVEELMSYDMVVESTYVDRESFVIATIEVDPYSCDSSL